MVKDKRTIFYETLAGERLETTWKDVFESIGRMREYFAALKRRFVDRDKIIDILMYAFMLRQNVLINGDTGTAKSALLDTLYSGIVGAKVWMMDLAGSTRDTEILGGFDVREMRESGRMVHMIEGSIGEANFAKTGEFFDASDGLLRLLLPILNERMVRRGTQIICPPLITTVADTNFDPDMLADPRREKLRAVVDRFLFRYRVDYVRDPRDRMRLIDTVLDLDRTTPLPPLTIQDVVLVSGVIRVHNLITDPYVREAYQAMTLALAVRREKEGGRWLSDRRFASALQILEVSALLAGRTVATFEDLEITHHVLAGNDTERQWLEEARRAALTEWTARAARREIEAEQQSLATILAQAPQAPTIGDMQEAEVQALLLQIAKAQEALREFRPESVEVGKRQTEAQHVLHVLRNKANHRLLMLIQASIPQIETDAQIDPQDVGTYLAQLNAIREALQNLIDVDLSSEEVRIAFSQTQEAMLQSRANLEVVTSVMRPLAAKPPEVT